MSSRLRQYSKSVQFFISAILLVLVSASALCAETIKRVYPIPLHGEMVMQVPADWDVSYVSMGETRPPVVTFYQQDKTDQYLFQLNTSMFWDDGYSRDIKNSQTIRDLVESTGQSALPSSVEQNLDLQEIIGSDGQGYYFTLTDARAGQGGFKYLLQGALNVGSVLVVFSLFTIEDNKELVETTLTMLKTAIHRYQPDV